MTDWYVQDKHLFPNWSKLHGCPSSLLWGPHVARRNNGSTVARFCWHRWICPFCYGRELARFLVPFESLRFTLRAQIFAEEASDAWHTAELRSLSFRRRFGGVATWRYIVPTMRMMRLDGPSRPTWLLNATWLYPGELTFAQQEGYLMEAFAYPIGLLDSTADAIKLFCEFMHTHKGRSKAGCYRNAQEET